MILVLGCGSIGRRHAANLKALGQDPICFDPDASRRAWIEKNLKLRTVARLEDGLAEKPAAAWICVPPHLHAECAEAALRRKIPCFIEKPLAHTVADGARILKLAKKAGVPVGVGYQLRQHPALLKLKAELDSRRLGKLLFLRAEVGQYLPDWRPWQDYRKSYTANRSMGGGILLDASHEIDLLLWLAGAPARVFCAAAKLSAMKIDVEDTAAVVFRMKTGALAEVHLDMVQRAPRRNLQAVCEGGTLLWDLPSSELRRYSAATKRWTSERFPADGNAPYLAETRLFLAAVAKRPAKGLVTAADGLRALSAAAAAQRSAKTGRFEAPRP